MFDEPAQQDAMRICCVTADLSDDDLDLPAEPGVVLRGSVAAVKISALLFAQPVQVITVSKLSHLRALLRRAHDAMSRRDPDGISTDEWDQLVADMGKEIGVTS
jgi:hypothetical protein